MKIGILSMTVGLSLWPNSAGADPSQIPIHVLARLAPGCPTASDFALSVIRRTRRLRLASPGEAGIQFDVAASAVPNGYIGQLQIRELDGRLTQRLVEGTNCSEIVNAFAFVAAVLVDPEAAAAVEKNKPAAPTPVEASPVVVEPVPATTPRRPRAVELAIGVAFGANSAAGPGIPANFGLRFTGTTQRLVFPFWAAVGGDYRVVASSNKVNLSSSTAGEASIGGWTTYLLASPLDWQPAGPLHLRPLVQLELGEIFANPVIPSPDNRRSHSKTWFAAGVGTNVEWQFARPLFAFMEGGLIYPLYKTTFYFVGADGNQHPAFAADSIGWNARLGLALHFW